MTLVEAKQQIANRYGFHTWAEYKTFMKNARSAPSKIEAAHDEVAELYAKHADNGERFNLLTELEGFFETQLRISVELDGIPGEQLMLKNIVMKIKSMRI